jgi:transposase
LISRGRRKKLTEDARRRGSPYAVVIRARIILALACDPCVSAAASALGVDPKTVRYWRDRYLREGRKGLQTRPRPGRPIRIDMVSRCQLTSMACGKPSDFGVEFRPVWTVSSLLSAFRDRNPDLAPLSRTSVVRILHQDGLRPHRMRVWLHSPDPLFREKGREICGLYLNPPPGAVVLCIDEKPGMQALSRKHPTRQPAPGQDGRIDFEYKRHGTTTFIGAFNPHTGEVFGVTPPNRKAPTLVAFMDTVANHWPDAEVHVVWDNLNTHLDGPDKRWTRFNERHGGRFHFHYTPIHASWMNQIENFFSILSRRVLKYSAHLSKKALAAETMAFIHHWNVHERHPFNWRFQGYAPRTADSAADRPSSAQASKGGTNGNRRRPKTGVRGRQAARA